MADNENNPAFIRRVPIRANPPGQRNPSPEVHDLAERVIDLLTHMRDHLPVEQQRKLTPEVWRLNAYLVKAGYEPVHLTVEDRAAFGIWAEGFVKAEGIVS